MAGVFTQRLGLNPAAGGGFTPEAETLFAAMSPAPDNARKIVINNLIVSLINDGIWSKLDVLWVMAAHDAQAARLNWKTPASFALTAVNSPTFTTDRGYAGNGSTSSLNTGWNPATNGSQYTLNSAALGFWVNAGTDTADSTGISGGAIITGSEVAFICPRGSADRMRGRMNQSAATIDFGASNIGTRIGLSVLNRSSSSLTTAYRNGLSVGTDAATSSAVPSLAMYVGATNVNGAALNFVDNRFSVMLAGASLSAVGA
jgi:hypothetical protein